MGPGCRRGRLPEWECHNLRARSNPTRSVVNPNAPLRVRVAETSQGHFLGDGRQGKPRGLDAMQLHGLGDPLRPTAIRKARTSFISAVVVVVAPRAEVQLEPQRTCYRRTEHA